jgi:hypothetical protein
MVISVVLFIFYETVYGTRPGSDRIQEVNMIVFFSAGPLEAFGRVAWQLLQDVQERLVFRAHCYLQSDILQYKPAAGDLAYPEKLEMMEVESNAVFHYRIYLASQQMVTL